MRILVTGGAGFIGSHIVDQYVAAGHEVAIVDNLWEEGGGKKANINPKARFYLADITDEAGLEGIFNEVRPEVVNHQAAQHSVAISTRNPQLDARVNVLGLLNVLINCTRVGTRKIIFASSGATYGTPEHLPVDEETPQHPESPYGITKMVAEHYLRYWHEANGLNYTALRYGNVYGPRQDPNGEAGVIAIFARRILAHEPVRIDWDGEQRKDYVYVGDVARASLLALDHGDNDICIISIFRGSIALCESRQNVYTIGMLENFDPSTIQDEALCQVFIDLMNLVESLHATVQEQAEEMQRLRDENNRLKGEQGKPDMKPNKPATALSSEKERRESKPHHKASKQAQIRIDRVEVVKGEQERLPHDAQFKGYEEVIVQDIDFRTENLQFRKEKYYSPDQKRTYLAQLPAGYQGQFGPGVRAWVLALYYAGGMSELKLLDLLHTVGLRISAGQLSDLLIKDQEQFHAERAAVVRAGLASSPWQHLDSTGTRVDGRNQQCHVLCNPLYTAYCTQPSKDRLSLLRVLLGGADPAFRWNELAVNLLERLGLAQKWCRTSRSGRKASWTNGSMSTSPN